MVASDPVLGKYALNPNQAAVSLDDFENLKDISDKVSLLGSSLNKPYEPVSYQDIQNVLSKGTSPEQKETERTRHLRRPSKAGQAECKP